MNNKDDKKALLSAIGMRISTQRKLMRLTQEELAERTDLTTQIISTAERGVKEIRIENLHKISIALNVSMDFLINGIDAIAVPNTPTNDYNELSLEQKALVSELLNTVVQYFKKENEKN